MRIIIKKIPQYTFYFMLAICLILFQDCAKMPVKQFYLLNYEPGYLKDRLSPSPYPCSMRIKDFDIERAYAKRQIVYRKSPYELQYYFYREWAVNPTLMITDIIQKHLAATSIVSKVVRRMDEGTPPDYELSGTIEAIEEYDSEQIWFAHIAMRVTLSKVKENKTIYFRRFDKRKKVYQHEPEYVIRVMSQILDYIVSQSIQDIDRILAKEYGLDISGKEMDIQNSQPKNDTSITDE